MRDTFFTQTHCSRCGGDLKSGRIMSMFNTQCICMKCADKEKQDPEYKQAVEAEHEQIQQGHYNFKGIRGGKSDG
jgi:hypothetical protein